MDTLIFLSKYGIGFLIGCIVMYSILKPSKKSKALLTNQRAYCFDCEIEMPVMVKDGHAYCSNCKLGH